MRFQDQIGRRLAALCGAGLALAGCASVDRFSGRMATYNSEAERVQDQSIMLNVLRAADYRPLAFTELQTVSGSLTPSASVSLTGPLSQNGSPTATTLSPTFGVSGGPTVQTTYINTQDFYRGILTPLPMQTIDLLVQRRIPSTVLFNLLFSRMVVRQISNSETDGKGALSAPAQAFTAQNDVSGTGEKAAAFQALVEALLNEGLTTGPGSSDATTIGPPLTDKELGDPEVVAKASAAGLKVVPADWCDLAGSPDDLQSILRRRTFDFDARKADINKQCALIKDAKKTPGSAKSAIGDAESAIEADLAAVDAPLVYRLVKPGGAADPQFCMAGPRSSDGHTQTPSGICAIDATVSAPATDSAAFKVMIHAGAGGYSANERRLCDALNRSATSGKGLDCQDGGWLANGLELALEPRSTYSIIYFLGEIERMERKPGAAPLLVKVGDPMVAIPEGQCRQSEQRFPPDPGGYACRPLFYMRAGAARSGEYLSVSYAGAKYAIPDDVEEAGKTNEVLDIVNELIALNHAAKDSPTSSLLTVVGVH